MTYRARCEGRRDRKKSGWWLGLRRRRLERRIFLPLLKFPKSWGAVIVPIEPRRFIGWTIDDLPPDPHADALIVAKIRGVIP
jgi:hypothetical protein